MNQFKCEKCRVCNHDTTYIFSGKLIGHNVKYYECVNCRYVQTEKHIG